MPYSIAQLNQMSLDAFVAALGTVFEETPMIAERAWATRPFTDITDLHRKMQAIVHSLSEAEQRSLICAHPDLASKTKMAEDSVQEQSGVGLDRLSPQEYDRFQQLNQRYKDKFGFPFIIAVRNHTKESILQAFEQRLYHSPAAELQHALTEIAQIAEFRLRDRVSNSHSHGS